MGRVIGLDYGESRIGVALSDPSRIVATGKGIVDGTRGLRHVLEEIGGLIRENGVDLLVIGYPINMNGTRGVRIERTEKFIARFAEEFPEMEIVRWDERLTTVAADRAMREMGVSQRKKGVSDVIAAVLILQSYLDSCAKS